MPYNSENLINPETAARNNIVCSLVPKNRNNDMRLKYTRHDSKDIFQHIQQNNQPPASGIQYQLKKEKKLTEEQIVFFINGVVNKSIPDYQTSALLMAICIYGLDNDELYFLTKAMISSGKEYNFHPEYKKTLTDKHSTGGIGDKVSIALAPLLTCFNLGVSKTSGRGLGFIGGTIDKLQSIGVKTNATIEEAKQFLKASNMFIIEQTSDIVPADKILYALRDVTEMVDSLPLVAASVLSKKFALNSDYIFIDIKYGNGAFCKNIVMAKKLSSIMQKLANNDMSHVLGRSIGNAIEVREVIDYLQDLAELGVDSKAGRRVKNDPLDYQAGIYLHAKNGCHVQKGVNVENCAYPLAICAERSAISAMVTAVNAPEGKVFTPCGACRQVISEFAQPDTKIIAYQADGKKSEYTVEQLLPFGFSRDFID
ncbi:putative cytidine deaminase [Dictyocaulus viviparus]|uniref:Putative cytidine deaminase n=1 Tax=Dictyocaulus viviparus TaxID=29172 RepID=A0A0D8XC06_DICVI|nr:putative cytidine deaminase [Dictyocaulus viviparus]